MMGSARPSLDDALDALDGAGTVDVHEAGGRTKVDVVEADKLGVRIRSLQVGHPRRGVGEQARGVVERVRAIPDRLQPIEVDAGLGGATVRTAPESMRRGRFFELGIGPEETEVKRFRVSDGERTSEDFTLTREQLRDLVDEIRD
jgi:hypothetical protein